MNHKNKIVNITKIDWDFDDEVDLSKDILINMLIEEDFEEKIAV